MGVLYNSPMLGGRTNEQWIAQYASSHTHPVNRLCHTFGIPLIVISGGLGLAAIFIHGLWIYAAGLFVFGWILQFAGHAFERKEPEFFHDWRFLLVGVRWWWAKMVAQLRAAGIEVKDPETYDGIGRFTRLHDPEGNPIELWQPA